MSYLKKEWEEFLSSFKLKTSFIYVFLIDVLFIGLVWLVSTLFGKLAQGLAEKLSGLNIQNISADLITESQAAALSSVIGSLFIYAILFAVILFAVCVLARSLIWNIVLKKKLTAKYIGKFTLLNLIWLAWIIPFILILLTQNPLLITWLTLLLGLVFAYLTLILYTLFTKHVKIFKSLGACFKLAATRIHLFLFPMLLSIIILLLINGIAKVLIVVAPSATIIISFVLLLIYAAWLRFYSSSVVLRVMKK